VKCKITVTAHPGVAPSKVIDNEEYFLRVVPNWRFVWIIFYSLSHFLYFHIFSIVYGNWESCVDRKFTGSRGCHRGYIGLVKLAGNIPF